MSLIYLYIISNKCKEHERRSSIISSVACLIVMIFFAFISSFRGSNIWTSYIHHFIFIFSRLCACISRTSLMTQLLVDLLAYFVRAAALKCNRWYHRDQGSNTELPTCVSLWWSSLHLFLHSMFQQNELYIFPNFVPRVSLKRMTIAGN